MQRISVDLPLPDSPITTNVSPRPTSNETSRTPIVWPVSARISRPVGARLAEREGVVGATDAEHLPQVRHADHRRTVDDSVGDCSGACSVLIVTFRPPSLAPVRRCTASSDYSCGGVLSP